MRLLFLVSLFCGPMLSLHADKYNTYFEEFFAAHLLPQNHPLRGWLEETFITSKLLDSKDTLQRAGFEILACLPEHPAVAKHPSVPGYVFKMYLNSEKKYVRDQISSVEWLLRRCAGAKTLRKWIETQKIRHFVVPEKWIYPLPYETKHPIILIATDMEIEDEQMTCHAWKTVACEEHLNELYSILKKGYGSVNLNGNIPYTKSGKFAFIDTEKIQQTHKMRKVKPYLSEHMQLYWDQLTR